MSIIVTEKDRLAYLAIFGNLPAADRDNILNGGYDDTISMQAIANHRKTSIAEYRNSTVAKLTADIIRLRSFIKSIDDDWVANTSDDDDEWSDGYEDCLAEYAKKARSVLDGGRT